MISGIGIDIIEVARLEKELSKDSDRFLQRVFTKSEADYCMSKRYPAQFLAARFAAKEAVLKALGTGLRNGFSWTEIEVIHDELGKPLLSFHGKVKEFVEQRQIQQAELSISHIKETAAAFVVLEQNKEGESTWQT